MDGVEDRVRDFVLAKLSDWGPDPVTQIVQRGEQSLTRELAGDPRLDAVCGWFAKPADEVLVGTVKGLLQGVNALVGVAATILANALVAACAQRHMVNRQAAQTNMAGGAFVALLLVLVAAFTAGE